MMLKIKIFDLNPCWLLHSIWHRALMKYIVEFYINVPAPRMFLQVSILQWSLLDLIGIMSLGMYEDEKNSNFVYRLSHSSTKVILERITSFFLLDLSIPIITTHTVANPWNLQIFFKENINHNNDPPYRSHILKWELDPNDNGWCKRVKMKRFCLQNSKQDSKFFWKFREQVCMNSKADVYVFQHCKMYLIRVISKEYEKSQEIKWYESRFKNPKKTDPIIRVKLSMIWVKKTMHITKIQKTFICVWFESSTV